MLYLVRAPEDKSGFCECPTGLVDAPFHKRDLSPSGGTGWMFTCIECRRGFDVAVAAEVPETLESLAKKATPRVRKTFDVSTGGVRETVLIKSPSEWIAAVQPLTVGLTKGKTYVFFDGILLPYRHGPVKFKGLFREHDLPDLPHIARAPLGDILTSPEYWKGEPLDKVIARLEQEEQQRRVASAAAHRPLWRRILDRFH